MTNKPTQISQFTLRALLALMLAVACFFGGARFGRERQRIEDEATVATAEAAAQNAGKEAEEARAEVYAAQVEAQRTWEYIRPLLYPRLPYIEKQEVAPGAKTRTKMIMTKNGKLVPNPFYVEPKHPSYPAQNNGSDE